MEKRRILNMLRRAYLGVITNREQRLYYRAIRRLFHLKPVLPYLEVNVVDHCNLNCKGCSHFSPLADKTFANFEQYDRDMKQLSQLVANIKMVRLLGGEPLLHPDISRFLTSTRTWFPKAEICLVTNGIILSSMTREFWESCRYNTILIEVSLYPPLIHKEADFVKLAKREEIMLNIVKAYTFFVFINSKGNSELERCFRICRKRSNHRPFLRQGKVYYCYVPALIKYFNTTYSTNIPDTGFVDLYDPKMNGWKVLSRIEKNSEACRYCTAGWDKVPTQNWAQSCRDQKEWDVVNLKMVVLPQEGLDYIFK